MNADARTTLERFTVCLGDAARPSAPENDVVLVPPAADLAAGFVLAQRLARDGRSVRLIGDGVTCERNWPPGLARGGHAPAGGGATPPTALTLTELGAYRSGDVIPPTRAVQEAMSRWLDELFGSVVPELPAGQVFWGTALVRLFRANVEAASWLARLAEVHGSPRAITARIRIGLAWNSCAGSPARPAESCTGRRRAASGCGGWAPRCWD